LVSLYFHIPFCTRKCPYCHFFVVKEDKENKKLFLHALKKEWLAKKSLVTKPIVSIYFGGGTPSKLSISDWQSIFSWFSDLPLTHDCEITVEANPEDLTKEYLEGLLSCGVNRLSIGVQSLDEELLTSLKRSHDAKKAKEAICLTKEVGFSNVSIDLMYDLPNQTLSSFERTLKELKALPFTHLSLYNLIFEQESLFHRKKKEILPLLPKESDSLAMHKLAVSSLEEMDLQQYEISAFAKNGKISVHNTGYWTARPFLGFGPSAFSYWENSRTKNISNLKKYCSMLDNGDLPQDFTETLSPDDRQKELLAVELRLFKGVDIPGFEKRQGVLCDSLKQSIKNLLNEGLVNLDLDVLKLSSKGRLFYDTVGEMIV